MVAHSSHHKSSRTSLETGMLTTESHHPPMQRFVQTVKKSYQSNGRRGRLTFSNSIIHHNTLESQSTITSRVIEL